MNYTQANPKSVQWHKVVEFAQQHQCQWSTDPEKDPDNWGIHRNDDPPHNRLLGPVFGRGPVSGVITQADQVLCEWGEPDRADMTFSVTKTYLALVAGVAYDQRLLSDLDEPVGQRIRNLGFDDDHNRQITWRQMLQFTSEWEGQCFGVPDQIDHFRQVSMQPASDTTARKGQRRELKTPGTHWEYNDVRINQFSLALMHLFEQPLPKVFKEAIMKPLGASENWQWHGYENSWATINGESMQSVPGGGHWGGGMQISAHDQSLVARLLVQRGAHNGQQLISKEWVDQMLTPCDIAPFYGYFTWLNRGPRPIAKTSPESFFSLGIGGQLIWHDPTRDLSAVFRWIDSTQINGFIEQVDLALAGANNRYGS